jgi:hypothetical protein
MVLKFLPNVSAAWLIRGNSFASNLYRIDAEIEVNRTPSVHNSSFMHLIDAD